MWIRGVLGLACCLASSLPAQPNYSEIQLQQARRLLTGERKDTAKAAGLLLELVQFSKVALCPGDLAYAYVVTVGSTTHGNLSGVAIFAVLPCGLVVRISNGYLSDAKGHPIEGNGNVPDHLVEPTIQDFLNGSDPVMDRAVYVLRRAAF